MTLKRLALAFVTLGVLIGLSGADRARAATPAEVDDSIKKGVDFLYSIQGPDGTWEGSAEIMLKQDGGYTSAAVYALLTAGESPKSPRLAKAIAYLKKADVTGIYAMGFHALALSKLDLTADVKAALLRDLKRLVHGGERAGTLGLYRYQFDQPLGEWDHSCSQYGALGVWACDECGMEVPDRLWEEIDAAWRTKPGQDTDGGWGYGGPEEGWNKSKVSMTAGGIATLFMTDDALYWQRAANCNGNFTDPAIEKGIKWIVPHLEESHDLYEWYGIERIGIACGYKYLGTFNWYKSGAEAIVHMQAADGSWNFDGLKAVGTSYAVLFLCKGRAPVIMNKLRYDMDGNAADPVDGIWNQRPRDDAGAAKFVGAQLEGLMNWQVVTLAVDADEFHDSPDSLSGRECAPEVFPAQEAKLRQFVEDGGMLLGNADCAAKPFADSFKELCTKLFADKDYKFDALPPTHPIFNRQQFLGNKWRTKPKLEGLSNGVRELAVLIPAADPAKAWQMNATKSQKDSFELIADIYLYAIDREHPTEKGVTYIVRANPAVTASGSLKLGRISYKGNWDPEPGGWRRLSGVMHNNNNLEVTAEPVALGAGKLATYTVASLTGTDAIQFSDAERTEIKDFVTKGGTLIVDAAGGSTTFADSVNTELTTIFGDQAKSLSVPVGTNYPIFKNLASPDIRYRSIMHTRPDAPHGPDIRVIEIAGKPAVIYSPEDLSAGLVGEPIDGVFGYTPETATNIMTSILMNVVNPFVAAPPSTAPAGDATQPAQLPPPTGGNPYTR